MIKRLIIGMLDKYQLKKLLKQMEKQYNFVKSYFLSRNMVNFTEENMNKIEVLNSTQFINTMDYKDEKWNYIKYLSEYRKELQQGNIIEYEDNKCCYGNKCVIVDEEIIVDTEFINDNWLCFFQNGLELLNYELSFDIELYSEFTEVQIAFKYQDLGNRYRFMIRNNSEVVFECVYKGEFYHSLWSVPYKLALEKKHKLLLKIVNNNFQFWVDNELVYSIEEKKKLCLGKDMCIILWNKDDKSNIKCNLSNFNISLIEI